MKAHLTTDPKMDNAIYNKKRLEWAKKEINILKENLFKGGDEESEEAKLAVKNKNKVLFDCYEFVCALRADNLDESYIALAKNIMIRLLETKPLTPVGDVDEEWIQIAPYKYVNERLPGFFKKVDEMNTDNVTYHYNERVICHDIVTNQFYGFGLANRVIDEMFPITVPYYPYGQYIVKVSECRAHSLIRENDTKPDFNVVAIHSVIRPDYGPYDINRFFREPKDGEKPNYGSWVEIDATEFMDLTAHESDETKKEDM